MKMHIVMVVAVAALVSSLAEARIVSKCELKGLLEAAALRMPSKNQTGMSEADFMAKSEYNFECFSNGKQEWEHGANGRVTSIGCPLSLGTSGACWEGGRPGGWREGGRRKAMEGVKR